jgi:type I restriction enzyme S subunit
MPMPSGTRKAITSTEFVVLVPNDGFSREYIYAKCCSEEFLGKFASLAIGTSTSHQRVKPENLLAMPSRVPDKKLVTQFTTVVAPMLRMCEQLRVQLHNLRSTRDLLLPRLLSGQIEVDAANGDVERQIEPEAA